MKTDAPTAPGRLRLLVLALQRDLHRLLGEALATAGVTPAQAEVLAVLAAQAPLTLHALGERLVCETGSPSRLADGLVRAGLVARAPAPGDGRKVLLRLTPAGEACAAAVAVAEAEFEAELAAMLAGQPVAEVNGTLWRLVRLLPSARALRLRFGPARPVGVRAR